MKWMLLLALVVIGGGRDRMIELEAFDMELKTASEVKKLFLGVCGRTNGSNTGSALAPEQGGNSEATQDGVHSILAIVGGEASFRALMAWAAQAFAYRRYLGQCNAQRYLLLEAEAKRQGKGVWSIGPSGITRPWDYQRGRRNSATSSGSPRKYRCKDIGSWSRAQKLFAEGHRYLDGDSDGEACESLR